MTRRKYKNYLLKKLFWLTATASKGVSCVYSVAALASPPAPALSPPALARLQAAAPRAPLDVHVGADPLMGIAAVLLSGLILAVVLARRRRLSTRYAAIPGACPAASDPRTTGGWPPFNEITAWRAVRWLH